MRLEQIEVIYGATKGDSDIGVYYNKTSDLYLLYTVRRISRDTWRRAGKPLAQEEDVLSAAVTARRLAGRGLDGEATG